RSSHRQKINDLAFVQGRLHSFLYPFPKEVVDPMFKRKPRYRDLRLKAGRNKAAFGIGLVSPSSSPPISLTRTF
ncbi:hypothetical protein, partial [Sinorhizobium psoraleae]|uniref:hypothetical protein n=1 Tax=Sinorhizobium psoraleae TaxID=520838 RepID=UPI0035E3D218